MKKYIALAFTLTLLLGFALPLAAAEDEAQYRDQIYGFRYPASWKLETAENGDIVVMAPDQQNAVLTFSIITDLIRLTGDPEADAPMIENLTGNYAGKNLTLSGEYEMLASGNLVGFRAFGSWRAAGQDAVMVMLTGERHLVSFVLVGDEAIALQEGLLDSLELLGAAPIASDEGYLRWDGPLFSLNYPEQYGIMEQITGVVFLHPDDGNTIIMARAYALNSDYSDELAPAVASAALPKSAKVEPNVEMEQIGARNAAVIRGTVASGPLAFYVIGSGRTALAMIFLGEEAVKLAEAIVLSAEVKE